MTNHLLILVLKRKKKDLKKKILLGVISLGGVEISSLKIVIYLPWTYMKLRCKGEPCRFRSLSVPKDLYDHWTEMVLLDSVASYRALECLHLFSWRIPSLKNASSTPPTSLLSSDTLKELFFVMTKRTFIF